MSAIQWIVFICHERRFNWMRWLSVRVTVVHANTPRRCVYSLGLEGESCGMEYHSEEDDCSASLLPVSYGMSDSNMKRDKLNRDAYRSKFIQQCWRKMQTSRRGSHSTRLPSENRLVAPTETSLSRKYGGMGTCPTCDITWSAGMFPPATVHPPDAPSSECSLPVVQPQSSHQLWGD